MLMDTEKLLKEYNLKIGDQILFTDEVEVGRSLCIYFITKLLEGVICLTQNTERYSIGRLFIEDWEPYNPNNYIGMKSCNDFINCEGCPLYGLRCQDLKDKDINTKWETYKKTYPDISSCIYNVDNKLKEYYIK